jgi:hypothetical protein
MDGAEVDLGCQTNGTRFITAPQQHIPRAATPTTWARWRRWCLFHLTDRNNNNRKSLVSYRDAGCC